MSAKPGSKRKRMFFKKTGSKKKKLHQPKKRTASLVSRSEEQQNFGPTKRQDSDVGSGETGSQVTQSKIEHINLDVSDSPEQNKASTTSKKSKTAPPEIVSTVKTASVLHTPTNKDSVSQTTTKPLEDDIKTTLQDPSDVEKQSIEHVIDSSAERISRQTKSFVSQAKTENGEDETIVPDPEIDGLSGTDESIDLLSKEIRTYQKKTSKLKYEIDVIKDDFEKEKKKLKHTIIDLRKELNRTAPLHDHKFLSLSQEIRDAIQEVENHVDQNLSTDPNALPPTPVLAVADQPQTAQQARPSTSMVIQPSVVAAATAQIPIPQGTPQSQTKRKDRKLLITGVSLLFLLISGAAVSYKIISPPQIDQALVDEHLKSGEVQGAQAVGEDAVVDRYAEVPIADTKWDNFEDPFYGIRFQWPINVAEKQKNGNGIAFLRKDGYLFKFQAIATETSLDKYWEQIKDTGLKYKKEESTLSSKTAYHLILDEESEYPGNRYLIQLSDSIVDIWYPTASDKFNQDDMDRVDKMLKSIIFF